MSNKNEYVKEKVKKYYINKYKNKLINNKKIIENITNRKKGGFYKVYDNIKSRIYKTFKDNGIPFDMNYFENITADDLSLKFDISPRYINEIYKSKYHETPLQYLQKVRIDRSKVLLLETDKDIVTVSFEVGYETLSSFYRTFRNIVGMSPNKFRTSMGH